MESTFGRPILTTCTPGVRPPYDAYQNSNYGGYEFSNSYTPCLNNAPYSKIFLLQKLDGEIICHPL